jgi:RsiW-degrading membrane proteinase PrsW (M82 family)
MLAPMSDTIAAALIVALIGGVFLLVTTLINYHAIIQAARIQAKGKPSQVGDAGEKEARKSS